MNILFTSVGRRSYLVSYFKKELNGNGEIHAVNSDLNAPALRVADKAMISPLIYDPDYIPFLLNYCKDNNIRAIISLFDIDLPILSKSKNLFEENGVEVIVSDSNVVDICNDKWQTFHFLKENGLNVKPTFLSIEEAIKSINCGKSQYPFIIKPRWGMGSIGIELAEDEEEIRVLYKIVKRKIERSYLSYESSQDMDKSIIIQEKIDGDEYGLDIINDLKGNYQTTIVKRKWAMRAGETDSSETVDNKMLRNFGEIIGRQLGHIGNLDTDVMLSDGKPYVLEMNARFGGGYPFSYLAGCNLPKAIISWLNGVNDCSTDLKARPGVKGIKDINIITF